MGGDQNPFFGRIALGGILWAAVIAFLSSLRTADNPTGDLTQNVEVFAANGVLKFHGRNETHCRDPAARMHPLTSGSSLKTGNGTADILLADNSIASLDANTEVKLGPYNNGAPVVQHSGRVSLFIEYRAGKRYMVKMRYSTARAVGTEFRTKENYPVDGAVTGEW